jgi:hypothetical protein
VGGRVLDSIGSGHGPMVVSCEHDNEQTTSIKSGESLDQLSDYQLLKEDSAPWSGSVNVRCDHEVPGTTLLSV